MNERVAAAATRRLEQLGKVVAELEAEVARLAAARAEAEARASSAALELRLLQDARGGEAAEAARLRDELAAARRELAGFHEVRDGWSREGSGPGPGPEPGPGPGSGPGLG